MKPFYKYLKLTCLVRVDFDEESKSWVATSDSLGMRAFSQSPEGAVDELGRELQRAENEAASKAKSITHEQTSRAKPDKEEQQETSSEDTEGLPGDSESGAEEPEAGREGLREKVLSGTAEELREVAREHGVEFEGLTKVPLREKLLEELKLDGQDS